MRNAFNAEIMKLKKNTMATVGTIAIAVFFILTLSTESGPLQRSNSSLETWVLSIIMWQRILLPIVGAFIITTIVHHEYQDQRIITCLTAPVSRNIFLFTKLLVWFIWHIFMLVVVGAIMMLGAFLFHYSELTTITFAYSLKTLFISGLLEFIVFTPILWIAVLQRKSFYPSLLAALVSSVLLQVGIYMPSEIAIFIPWAAASFIATKTIATHQAVVCTASVGLFGTLVLIFAFYSFNKQDF